MSSAQRAFPRLIAITDAGVLAGEALFERARALASSALPGTVAVLLRDHGVGARQRLAWGRELRALTRDSGQQLWVADRLDLALLLEADAVHLGEASVPAAAARSLVGPRALSRAWHQLRPTAQALAELAGVDALLLSPVIAPRKGRPALGVAGVTELTATLAEAQRAARVYALGGVDATTAAACLRAGAWGVAAIGSAWDPRPEPLLAALAIGR